MESKYHIATETARAGIEVVIANGKRTDILLNLLDQPDETPHTVFQS